MTPPFRTAGCFRADDIDGRIVMACRLAQAVPTVSAETLRAAPLMVAAEMLAEAIRSGGDTGQAWVAYDAELNRFIDEFTAKMIAYRTDIREIEGGGGNFE